MNRQFTLALIGCLFVLVISTFIQGLPAGPSVDYVSNSSYTTVVPNRTEDAKGTITTVTMNLNQQVFNWKAYVGQVTGTLVLDDASGQSIYDWSLATLTGEVYASRYSGINWVNISCATTAVIDTEQTAMGMNAAVNRLNATFNDTLHKEFLVGTLTIANSTCQSAATYINDTPQTLSETAYFQEILLEDLETNYMVYATNIEVDNQGYNDSNYDFQLMIAENESSATPTMYYFWLELG